MAEPYGSGVGDYGFNQAVVYVRTSVSFGWPKDVPARALRMFSRLVHLDLIILVWGVNVSNRSRLTPRILGVLSRGRVVLPY